MYLKTTMWIYFFILTINENEMRKFFSSVSNHNFLSFVLLSVNSKTHQKYCFLAVKKSFFLCDICFFQTKLGTRIFDEIGSKLTLDYWRHFNRHEICHFKILTEVNVNHTSVNLMNKLQDNHVISKVMIWNINCIDGLAFMTLEKMIDDRFDSHFFQIRFLRLKDIALIQYSS